MHIAALRLVEAKANFMCARDAGVDFQRFSMPIWIKPDAGDSILSKFDGLWM
jgi:hypothetical protein